MRFRELPPAEYLRERLSYDPETGEFRWKAKPGNDRETNRWNSKHSGKTAGCLEASGYIRLSLDGTNYLAHRIAWRMMTGEEKQVDHKNNKPSENSWRNLREATQAQNAQHMPKNSRNTSGFRGVCWDKASGKWISQITKDKKRRTLGRFDLKEDAKTAYREAAIRLHGEFIHESVLAG